MIIYDLRTPIECTDCGVGVVGENEFTTQKFVIRGMADEKMTFAIHLRFADGQVNSVVAESVTVQNGQTEIAWKVRKNDIFAHGFFDVQLEGRNDEQLVFQTEIVTMYAEESIPIEDRQYENPNSETLKLRDETKQILLEIEKNAKIINESDLSKKADKSDVQQSLDAKENKTQKVSDRTAVSDTIQNYPSVEYLDEYYYDFEQTDEMLDKKLDKAEMEKGTGTLSPHAASVAIVQSADFVYQKVGNTVTLNVNVVFNEGTNSNVIFTNLPFVCKNSINPREMCITNCKTTRIWAINRNNTWLNLITNEKSTFVQDETLAFTLIYQIS